MKFEDFWQGFLFIHIPSNFALIKEDVGGVAGYVGVLFFTEPLLEKFVGIGYSSISMDVKKLKPEGTDANNHVWHFGDNNCEGSSKYNFQSLESFYLTAGLGWQKIIFRKRVLGVQAGYRITPYSWFGKVERGFGHSVVSASINFRF